MTPEAIQAVINLSKSFFLRFTDQHRPNECFERRFERIDGGGFLSTRLISGRCITLGNRIFFEEESSSEERFTFRGELSQLFESNLIARNAEVIEYL